MIQKEQEARQLLMQGNAIGAIKLLRDHNALDLKGAKGIVDKMREEMTPHEQSAARELYVENVIVDLVRTLPTERKKPVLQAALSRLGYSLS